MVTKKIRKIEICNDETIQNSVFVYVTYSDGSKEGRKFDDKEGVDLAYRYLTYNFFNQINLKSKKEEDYNEK